jgi:hypothetical protein
MAMILIFCMSLLSNVLASGNVATSMQHAQVCLYQSPSVICNVRSYRSECEVCCCLFCRSAPVEEQQVEGRKVSNCDSEASLWPPR